MSSISGYGYSGAYPPRNTNTNRTNGNQANTGSGSSSAVEGSLQMFIGAGEIVMGSILAVSGVGEQACPGPGTVVGSASLFGGYLLAQDGCKELAEGLRQVFPDVDLTDKLENLWKDIKNLLGL